MKFHTEYLNFKTKRHREYINLGPGRRATGHHDPLESGAWLPLVRGRIFDLVRADVLCYVF